MHLALPDNRIKSLAELTTLEEAYFVVPGNYWARGRTMEFSGDVLVIKWPTSCIGQSQDLRIHKDAFRLGAPFEEGRPAYAFANYNGVLAGVKVSDFNLVKFGRKKYGPAAVFRTQEEADIWGVTVSLSLDHVGHKINPVHDFTLDSDLYRNVLAILTVQAPSSMMPA